MSIDTLLDDRVLEAADVDDAAISLTEDEWRTIELGCLEEPHFPVISPEQHAAISKRYRALGITIAINEMIANPDTDMGCRIEWRWYVERLRQARVRLADHLAQHGFVRVTQEALMSVAVDREMRWLEEHS